MVRSQYTEETLPVASAARGHRRFDAGVGAFWCASAFCPETRAMTVAITDEDNVLACAGEFEEKAYSPDSPIHTLSATRYVIEHGIVQSFNRMVDVVARDGSGTTKSLPALSPHQGGDRTVGTLKFDYKTPRAVDRYPVRACPGFAESCPRSLPSTSSRCKGNHSARRGACAAGAD